jgi:hypothetical protein
MSSVMTERSTHSSVITKAGPFRLSPPRFAASTSRAARMPSTFGSAPATTNGVARPGRSKHRLKLGTQEWPPTKEAFSCGETLKAARPSSRGRLTPTREGMSVAGTGAPPSNSTGTTQTGLTRRTSTFGPTSTERSSLRGRTTAGSTAHFERKRLQEAGSPLRHALLSKPPLTRSIDSRSTPSDHPELTDASARFRIGASHSDTYVVRLHTPPDVPVFYLQLLCFYLYANCATAAR